MTEPTAKPNAQAGSQSAIEANGNKPSNAPQGTVNDAQYPMTDAQKDDSAVVFDKAALLALFTVDSAVDTAHTFTSQVQTDASTDKDSVAAQRLPCTVLSMSVHGFCIWLLPIPVRLIWYKRSNRSL